LIDLCVIKCSLCYYIGLPACIGLFRVSNGINYIQLVRLWELLRIDTGVFVRVTCTCQRTQMRGGGQLATVSVAAEAGQAAAGPMFCLWHREWPGSV